MRRERAPADSCLLGCEEVVVPRWVNVGCGVRGLVGAVQIGACGICFAVSTIWQVTTLSTHTFVETVCQTDQQVAGSALDSATCCLLAQLTFHLPAVEQQGSRLATRAPQQTNTSVTCAAPRLHTSLHQCSTSNQSKITCLAGLSKWECHILIKLT